MTLIRADGSSTLGLGHIMRCIALAQQLEDEVHFAALDAPQGVPYPLHLLRTHAPQELIALIEALHVTLLVIDHYGIDAAYERTIKEATGVRILSLDDTYAPHHCDILLNHNLYADAARYKGLVPQGCELRCGKPLIRKEFYSEKQIARAPIYDVLIAMGGSDATNLTPKIISLLPQEQRICILTTTANAHLEELQAVIKHQSNIELHVNSSEVARLMHQSRFAIITPSVIVHEVLFMGLAFIAVQTAANQNAMAEYLQTHGYKVIKQWSEDAFQKLYRSL